MDFMRDMLKIGFFLTVFAGLVPQTLTAGGTDRELFLDAEARFGRASYVTALPRYQELLQNHPLSAFGRESRLKSVQALYFLGRYEEAASSLDLYVQRHKSLEHDPLTIYWRALILLAQERTEEAERLLAHTLEGQAEDDFKTVFLKLHGEAASQLQLYPQALPSYQLYVDRQGVSFPASVPELDTYLFLLHHSGQHALLLSWLEKTRDETLPEPWKSRLLWWQAESLTALGRTKEAEVPYGELVQGASGFSTPAFQRLYNLYQAQKREDELVQLMAQAEKRLSGQPHLLKEVWTRAGIASYQKGQLDTAEAYFLRVWALREEGEVPALVPFYLSLLAEKKSHGELAEFYAFYGWGQPGAFKESLGLQYGQLLLRQNKAQRAVEVFDQLRQERDLQNRNQVLYLHASALTKAGQYEAALKETTAALSSGITGAFHPPFLRLRASLEIQLGKTASSLETLRSYLALNPQDHRSALELLGLELGQKQFQVVADGMSQWDKKFEKLNLRASDVPLFVRSRLTYALALLGLRNYKAADAVLTPALSLRQYPGQDEWLPSLLFYGGWAKMRLSPPDYLAAVRLFSELEQLYPQHSLGTQALHLKGTSQLVLGRPADAEKTFRTLSLLSPPDLYTQQAPLFLGQSLVAQSKRTEAIKVYQDLSRAAPTPAFGDQAQFELARLWEAEGNLDLASQEYLRLSSRFPESPMAEEGLYRRGEMYFAAQSWERAREAYGDYRRAFPRGRWADQSLYWAGMAARELKEPFAAALHWTTLLQTYPQSPYRVQALFRMAGVYLEQGDLKEAQKHYKNLESLDPKEAGSLGVGERLKEIELLLGGQSEKEARLLITVSREKRAATPAGREALLALARLYLFEDSNRLTQARQLLDELLAQPGLDANSQAQIYQLLGEYWYRQGDRKKAAEEFLKIVGLKPANRDLTAYGLYRAAEMLVLLGDRTQAQTVFTALQSHFPGSDWVLQAQKLMESRP